MDFFQRSVIVLAFGFLAFCFRFIFEQKKEEDINAKQYYLSIENASTTIEGKEIEIVG